MKANANLQVEKYTPARIAELLLNNAITLRDYRLARKEVRAMGLDPDQIPHRLPKSSR